MLFIRGYKLNFASSQESYSTPGGEIRSNGGEHGDNIGVQGDNEEEVGDAGSAACKVEMIITSRNGLPLDETSSGYASSSERGDPRCSYISKSSQPLSSSTRNYRLDSRAPAASFHPLHWEQTSPRFSYSSSRITRQTSHQVTPNHPERIPLPRQPERIPLFRPTDRIPLFRPPREDESEMSPENFDYDTIHPENFDYEHQGEYAATSGSDGVPNDEASYSYRLETEVDPGQPTMILSDERYNDYGETNDEDGEDFQKRN